MKLSSCGLVVGVALGSCVTALAQTTISPDQWGTMQSVAGSYPEQTLYYNFTGSATKPSVVTCQFQPSSFTPGSYDPGYIAPGWIMMEMGDGHTDGSMIMEIDKPYGAAWNPNYTEVLLGNEGRGINQGTYVPGGLYTITFTYNRTASTIQIDVTGPTSWTRTVASNGRDITRLTFHGPNWPSMGSSSFGNVSVQLPIAPSPRITGVSLSGTTLMITATNGPVSGSWTLLQSPDMTVPLTNWTAVTSGTFDGSGNLSTNILNTATDTQQFYTLKL